LSDYLSLNKILFYLGFFQILPNFFPKPYFFLIAAFVILQKFGEISYSIPTLKYAFLRGNIPRFKSSKLELKNILQKSREGDGGTFPGMNKKGGRYQLFDNE